MSLSQMSFAGAVMIFAITIICALAISLLPKKIFLALWGIAVARLLLPFSLPSMFSVYSLIGNQASGLATAKVPQIDKVLPIDPSGQMAAMPVNVGNTASIISLWGAVWAAGVLVCAVVFAIAYWKYRQEFQTSLPVKNDFIKSWLDTHQQKRPISIRQSSRFSAPLTYGVFRPVILLPTLIPADDGLYLPLFGAGQLYRPAAVLLSGQPLSPPFPFDAAAPTRRKGYWSDRAAPWAW